MSIFDRFRRRAVPAPEPLPQPPAGAPAPGLPTNHLPFASQSFDSTITIGRSDQELLQQHFAEAKARFPGPMYLAWLQFFHQFVEPRTYLEIGVETGASLALAQPPTLAVGVDPMLQIKHVLKARHKLYSQTSDEFFATQDIEAVFEGDAISLAFIDGMHTFDQALKDFSHVERHAARLSIVLFHDIFPLNALTASRERRSVFWTGDTWKAICLLRKHRPDLKVFTIPTCPSGLAVVTHLDPESTVLTDTFDTICAEAEQLAYDDHHQAMGRHLNEIANEPRIAAELLNG